MSLRFLVPAVFAFLSSGCLLQVRTTESRRGVTGFQHVVVRGTADVEVREADGWSVRVTAGDQDAVSTWVEGDTLVIDERGGFGLDPDIVVEVPRLGLASVTTLDSASADVETTWGRERGYLTFEANGSSTLRASNAPARHVAATASDRARLEVRATESITAWATESADVTVRGAPASRRVTVADRARVTFW